MLLLDHNIQKQIAIYLNSIGVPCNRASELGWAKKRNGDLVDACAKQGFTAIITTIRTSVKAPPLLLRDILLSVF